MKIDSHYFWWIPTVIAYYVIYSYLAKQNNELGGKWFWIAIVFGLLCPFWAIVSRISKNILFDGILYDNIIFLTYIFTMIYLGAAEKLTSWQWFGLALVVSGSVVMRTG